MRSTLTAYFNSYFRSGISFTYLLLVTAMMSAIVFLYYSGNWILDPGLFGNSLPSRFGFHYLLYFVPFAAAWMTQRFFNRNSNYLANRWLLFMVLAAPAIFALRVSFNISSSLLFQSGSEGFGVFWYKCLGWITRSAFVILCVGMIWWLKDRKTQALYGIKSPDTGMRLYVFLLLLAVPVTLVAATNPGFQDTYPRAQVLFDTPYKNSPLHYIIFELSYGFDFLSIELFFRGLLVIGLMRIGGMNCILPAACFYCCIHLGKPMGEAISSFFGGILLGIISYHTKSIRGSLFVHLGLAWMMEIMGYLAQQL